MKELKVLAVDDDPINLKLLEVMLKKYGKFQTCLLYTSDAADEL